MREFPLYTADECKIKLARYRGRHPRSYPEFGTGKYPEELKIPSTKLCIADFQFLANIRDDYLFRFIAGTHFLGKIRLKRLSASLWLADNGYIEKSQRGVYYIHDEPIMAAVKEMKISINITAGNAKLSVKNEDDGSHNLMRFDRIFKGK